MTTEIDLALARGIVKIIQEPLLYFSEADVQQQLCESLMSIPSLSRLYPTSVSKGKGSKSVYKTSLVHREYGAGNSKRMDIAVFNKSDLLEIDSPSLKKGEKYLTPEFCIEIGTEKTSDTLAHLKNDLAKLRKSKKKGYLIHIYKDVTQAKSGTLSRQKTEARIKKDFKDIFLSDKGFPNIRIIAVLLRTLRNQTRMRGKCEIFNNGRWEKINVSNKIKIQTKLLEVMK
jgi:hypothetical protein